MADETANAPRRANKVVAITGAVLVLAVAAAIYFAFMFVEGERARNLQDWQIRLGIVADSRAAAVGEWVDQNFDSLRELAENASLQLYMTELAIGEGDTAEVTDEAAQAAYLRNLLVAVADRTGFSAPPDASAEINANVERVGVAGIGLLNAAGRPIVSTPGMPPISGRLRSAVAKALNGEPAIIDVFKGATNLPTIGFALPIYGIQEDQGAEGIGVVIGLRVVDADLFARLDQPGETEETAETYLVRATDNQVEYLSPLADGTPPLKRALALDTPGLAAAFALRTPGGFAIRTDYANTEVLATSRPVPDLPWVLVRKVARAEALSGTENRLQTMMIVFIVIIAGVFVSIIAVWKHGSSLRATQAAENYRVAAERFQNLSKFMNLISNSQDGTIVAVSDETLYTYANEPAAKQAGIPAADMMGKPMASIMGPIKAKTFADINRDILRDFERTNDAQESRRSHVLTFGDEDGDDVEVIKSDHIPLRGDRDHPPGVLMIQTDITDLTRERRRSEQMTRRLIAAVMDAVDRRDPMSANHSRRVAEVARTIAQQMDLSPLEVKTVETAGNLLGLGRVFISPKTLAKTETLSEAEQHQMATSYLVTVGLIEDVPFEGAVVDTIRQSGEHWDGTGPMSMKEGEILSTARILSVASAFVDLITPNPSRRALTFNAATDVLMSETGKRYDRGVVSALLHHLENRGGRDAWDHFRNPPNPA